MLWACADALAAGVHRTPPRLLLLTFAFGGIVGVGAGALAAALGGAQKRPVRQRPLALVAAFFTLITGLAVVSKDVSGGARPFAAIAVAASTLGTAVFLWRATLPRAASVIALAAIPGTAVVAWALGPSLAALALALPLATSAALVRFRSLRPTTATAIGALAFIALALPALLRDPGRPDPILAAANSARVDASADAPDVLLVLVDTLRADAVPDAGLTDGGIFRSLIEGGARFERCISTAPWTLPSVSSILTSLLPSQHGATEPARPIPRDLPVAAELFSAAGYETAAFTGGAFVSGAFRMDRGFDHFEANSELAFTPFRVHTPLVWRAIKNRYAPVRGLMAWVNEHRGARGVRTDAEAWLETRDTARPCFLLAHTYEAHDYYIYDANVDPRPDGTDAPSPRFRNRLSVNPKELLGASQADLDWFQRVYHNRIAHVDIELGALLETVEASSARDLVVVLVSDHGEGFDAERRRAHHGGRLHEDLVHVPLLLRAPHVPARRRVSEVVRTIDVLPTLLDLAHIEIPTGLEGRSLLPIVRGLEPDERPAWSEEVTDGYHRRALRLAHDKLIGKRDRVARYDLIEDPLEERPQRAPRDHMLVLFESFETLYPRRESATIQVDDTTLERMRALGYVD